MTNLSHLHNPPTSNDIDLYGVFESIWQQKRLVIAITLLAGAVAAGKAYMVVPQYKVDTVLRVPAINELDALNRSDVYSLPPREALIRVGSALDSYDVRRGYFLQHPEFIKSYGGPGVSSEQAFADFNQTAIDVVQPGETQSAVGAPVIVRMRYPAGVKGDEILNGFVQYAIDFERKQIATDLKVIIDNRMNEIDVKLAAAHAGYDSGKARDIATLLEADNQRRGELQDELKALRVQMKEGRQARVAQLDEAINIARSLGLKKPSTPSSMNAGSIEGTTVVRTEVNNQQLPLYFMGTDALEAERRVLSQRSSDDFANPRIAEIGKELALLSKNRRVEILTQRQNEEVFLRDVEPLHAERARLSKININVENLRLVSVDQQAFQPLHPLGPRKAVIIAVGLMVGAALGVIVAVLRGIWTQGRQSRAGHVKAG